MPYIPQKERPRLDDYVGVLARRIETIGQFTYVVYKLMLLVAKKFGISYATYASLLGALTSTLNEFYRREVSVYEDEKELENGSVQVSQTEVVH
jgi:hypothetical protein